MPPTPTSSWVDISAEQFVILTFNSHKFRNVSCLQVFTLSWNNRCWVNNSCKFSNSFNICCLLKTLMSKNHRQRCEFKYCTYENIEIDNRFLEISSTKATASQIFQRYPSPCHNLSVWSESHFWNNESCLSRPVYNLFLLNFSTPQVGLVVSPNIPITCTADLVNNTLIPLLFQKAAKRLGSSILL